MLEEIYAITIADVIDEKAGLDLPKIPFSFTTLVIFHI